MNDTVTALGGVLPLLYEEDKLLDRLICIRCRRGAPLDAPRISVEHVEGCEVGVAEHAYNEKRKERNKESVRRMMRSG